MVSGSSTGSPLTGDLSLSSTVVEVEVEVEVDDEDEVVDTDVVVESADSSAAGLHAAKSSTSVTSLATVVRIREIVRIPPGLVGINR